MNQLQTVEQQFAREIAMLAASCALPVREQDVLSTFSVYDAAKASATQCFRLDVPQDVLPLAAPVLRGMKRTYRAEIGCGSPVAVTCVLSGGIKADAPLDWSGKPVETLG